ncbi:MAG TPA: nucleotidyltransferase family protein [Anaerolineales bacterium]|nr:nucleotidyltransferase family protein [Anaerolineales bacterium]
MIRSAILLAAGRGKRLRPFTDTTPKPLLPIRGRTTLDYVLAAVSRAGIERVCLVTHHLEQQIHDFVASGSKWDLQATYAHQNELRGSGDALMSVPQEWIRPEPVMVVATDYILKENTVVELVQAHERQGAEITMSLKECPPEEQLNRSSVDVDADWRVTRIIEKPAAGQVLSPYAASILFILPPAIWEYIPRIQPSSRGEIELQTAVQMMIDDGFQAYGLLQPAPEEWSPAHYLTPDT